MGNDPSKPFGGGSRLRTAFSRKGKVSETRKILVLGCMGAGKTTLCRMLAKAANAPTPPRRLYKHTIENNLLEIVKAIYRLAVENKLDEAGPYQSDMDILKAFRHREDLHTNTVAAMKRILQSHLFAELVTIKKRILELPYNSQYYVSNSDRILDGKYDPTEADLTAVYSQTVGVNYNSIELGVVQYQLYELPGHHIVRRWWSDFYEKTTVVIFVIDLSDLCRDAFYSGGHLQDKVRQILLQVTMSRLLQTTSFILLFNKRDLLEEIGQGYTRFSQINAGIRTWESAEKWYMEQCLSAVPPTNAVYSHSMSLTKRPDMSSTLFDSLDKIFRAGRRSVDLE